MAQDKIAKVALPIALNREFDYSFGASAKIKPGMRVLVDFRARKTLAVVTAIKKESKITNLKSVLAALENNSSLTSEQIRFARILSSFYPYNFGEFLFMMLPSYLKRIRNVKIFPVGKLPNSEKTYQHKFMRADTFSQRYYLWRSQIKEKLETGSVLVCFPQVSYLNEAKKILDADFGPKIKVMHSYESEKDFFTNWQGSRQNSLILGTRVAIFCYPADLKMIIVEDENNYSYFQEEKPFYHLLQVAFLLSKFKKIDLILSSSLPALYTYKLIRDKKISLQEVAQNQRQIKVVQTQKYLKPAIISPVLGEILRKNIAENKKTVIFLNRKGFAPRIICSSCGQILACEHCTMPLRFLSQKNNAVCPSCAKVYQLPKICSHCNAGRLRLVGIGNERLEAKLKEIFPQANIAAWKNIKEQTQIAIATREIISSLYNPQVFDSGIVLDADRQMSFFDYEAVFETFIYLQKISLFCKNLVIFTHNSKHYLFSGLQTDWRAFYEAELKQRKALSLPPFGTLIKITLRLKDENKLFNKVSSLYNKLKPKVYEIYGPLKEHPFKLRGKFRYTLIIKGKNRRQLWEVIKDEVLHLRVAHLYLAIVVK
jgi:primosomal protein N' (replication factor Y)